MPRRAPDKTPTHYPNPPPVRLDYSDTYFSNDYLTDELGYEMQAMDKSNYRKNLKKDEELKRAQEESEYIASLKEAIEVKNKQKGPKLDLGRNYNSSNKQMYGEYWGGPDRKTNQSGDSNKKPQTQIRPLTTAGPKSRTPQRQSPRRERPKTSLGQITSVIDATSRFRRAAERLQADETPAKPAARRPKSVFYTGVDDSDDDEKKKKGTKKKKSTKQYGIQHTMRKKAHMRSRRELEELVRLEALKKEKRMTHADVRQERLQELREDNIRLRSRIDHFFANLDILKKAGVTMPRIENKRPQTAFCF